jgi:hypothetical protein
MAPRWVLSLGFILAASLLPYASAHSQVPCDVKGISVGDKMTREQLMQQLSISKFKLNPKRSSFEETLPLLEKYGVMGAAEIEEEKIGPFCDEKYCTIPFGLTVGDDHIPIKVYVALTNDTVTEINVFFNAIFWDDIFKILTKKYGPEWSVERRKTGVMDYQTKKIDQWELIVATHRLGGKNPRTNDTCSLGAANIDLVFYHHDALGSLHSIFWIKRDARDF